MERHKQRNLVDQLIFNIAGEVRGRIDMGDVPEDWDGHELRQWLANKFNDSARMSDCMRDKRSKRRRDFDNEVIVRNL